MQARTLLAVGSPCAATKLPATTPKLSAVIACMLVADPPCLADHVGSAAVVNPLEFLARSLCHLAHSAICAHGLRRSWPRDLLRLANWHLHLHR